MYTYVTYHEIIYIHTYIYIYSYIDIYVIGARSLFIIFYIQIYTHHISLASPGGRSHRSQGEQLRAGAQAHRGEGSPGPGGSQGIQWRRTSEVFWGGFSLKCPLVNIQKPMENHHFQWKNPLFLWSCSIAMLNYQRVNIPKNGGFWIILEFSWKKLYIQLIIGVAPLQQNPQVGLFQVCCT